jgi:hypothetical protein
MAISNQELGKMARNLLGVLEKEKIISVGDLERAMGRKFLVNDGEGDFVSTEIRPSNFNTAALVVSYVRPGVGIPIEVRVNTALEYSTIIAKSCEELDGYEPFGRDNQNNTAKSMTVRGTDVALLCQRLWKIVR